MHLPLFIAKRYLFAKKSHNVINIISVISAIGMAVGTAALVIILSVYNGFDSLVKSSLSNVEPDILITPSKGKVFIPEGEAFDWAYDQPAITTMSSILQDNVYISYDGHNGIAMGKGVDRVYEEESPIRDHMIEGKFALHHGEIPMGVVGSGLSYSMEISHRFLAPIQIYYPARDRSFSPANPAASLESIKIFPSGVFSVNPEIDSDLIILPLEQMRQLLGYTDEVSGVELRVAAGTSRKALHKIIRNLQDKLGEGFSVKDRFQQNESLYKMMKYEKVSVYLILIFVIIIIAFNIFGSLSMLMIEKKEDIGTLRSMGATPQLVKRIFILEGWMISLLGLAAGLVLGVGFTLAQQKFGFIKMPGSFATAAYPVILQWKDLILTAISVAAIGYLIALLPVLSESRRHSR